MALYEVRIARVQPVPLGARWVRAMNPEEARAMALAELCLAECAELLVDVYEMPTPTEETTAE